jgi:hypothetical protein
LIPAYPGPSVSVHIQPVHIRRCYASDHSFIDVIAVRISVGPGIRHVHLRNSTTLAGNRNFDLRDVFEIKGERLSAADIRRPTLVLPIRLSDLRRNVHCAFFTHPESIIPRSRRDAGSAKGASEASGSSTERGLISARRVATARQSHVSNVVPTPDALMHDRPPFSEIDVANIRRNLPNVQLHLR